jgi:hypothetical protein
VREAEHCDREEPAVLAGEARADARAGEHVVARATGVRHAQREEPRERGEEQHHRVDGEEMRFAQLHDRACEQESGDQAGDTAGHAARDQVRDRRARGAARGGNGAPHHHVADFVGVARQRQGARDRFRDAPDAVERPHRQRSVHEELAGLRRIPHASTQQIRALEHVVLVDVEVEVGSAPGEADEAEQRRESADGGQQQRGRTRRNVSGSRRHSLHSGGRSSAAGVSCAASAARGSLLLPSRVRARARRFSTAGADRQARERRSASSSA